MSLEQYLAGSRILSTQPTDADMHAIYAKYDAFVRQALQPDASHALPPLHITYSLQRHPAIITYGNTDYFVYDQHLGGTLNTLNRLYLNARRKMDSVLLGLRMVAERLLVVDNHHAAFVTAFNYQELSQQHAFTYLDELPENAAARTIYTAGQEVFMMASTLGTTVLPDTTGPAFIAASTARIQQLSAALFDAPLDYTPFNNPRLHPIPKQADSPIARHYVLDTISALIATAFLRQETDARGEIIRGLDLLTRHLALLDAMARLCAGQWVPEDGLGTDFARRRTNIRSTMKAMREQYFTDEPGVDISDLDTIYEQVILEPVLEGVFAQVNEMLGQEERFMDMRTVSPDLLTTAAIAEMVGFGH